MVSELYLILTAAMLFRAPFSRGCVFLLSLIFSYFLFDLGVIPSFLARSSHFGWALPFLGFAR